MQHETICRLGALVVAFGLVSVVGCGESGGGSSETTDVAEFPAPKSYTVDGVIAAKPSSEAPAAELMVTHEEIPDFVGRDGEVVGMRAMTMPFPNIADGVDLDGIEVGDSVRLTFLVDYSADPIYVVTAIEEAQDEADPAGDAPE